MKHFDYYFRDLFQIEHLLVFANIHYGWRSYQPPFVYARICWSYRLVYVGRIRSYTMVVYARICRWYMPLSVEKQKLPYATVKILSKAAVRGSFRNCLVFPPNCVITSNAYDPSASSGMTMTNSDGLLVTMSVEQTCVRSRVS